MKDTVKELGKKIITIISLMNELAKMNLHRGEESKLTKEQKTI